MDKKFKIGVIGAGKMGMSIVQGAVLTGLYKKNEIILFNRNEDKRKRNADDGYAVTDDYIDIYKDAEMVIFGIKPQNFDEVMPIVSKISISKKPLVISIAAGISMKYLQGFLGEDCHMIRIMPNTPLLLGKGASAIAKNSVCSDEELQKVLCIFNSIGITVVFNDENKINDIIPANGSAPAYVYYFIDAMVQNAIKHGIERESAIKLICKTFEGAACMVEKTGKTPDQLINDVCSPGGTTIEAIKVLKNAQVNKIIDQASDKCIKRAYELGK